MAIQLKRKSASVIFDKIDNAGFSPKKVLRKSQKH